MRFLVLALLALASTQTAPPQPATAPPATDIYELTFSGAVDTLREAKPRAVATTAGYDNQPFYAPDGGTLLFTANRDGKQTDIFQFDRKSGRVTQLVSTTEGEYSPTVTPDGSGFTVIRVEPDGTQRLWRFDRNGTNPRVVLADIKPVGYHVWIDGDQLALFVLGQPATLQLARVSTGKAAVVAKDIGRSLQRIPASSAVSFVQREADKQYVVKRLDPATGAISTIVTAPATSADRDTAWLPDGTLLISAGTKILAWRSVAPEWREVFDSAAHKLGVVSRIAASADGRSLAIVVAETAR
jgi:dipeptidyl aminopeptidase/acylaminoacyl peptidase